MSPGFLFSPALALPQAALGCGREGPHWTPTCLQWKMTLPLSRDPGSGGPWSHSLIPVTNSLKLISESLFLSRSRNMRPASTGVWEPQAQGVRLPKSSWNWVASMRYCSR